MKMPLDELRLQAKTPFRLLPGTASLLEHFARSIADEIKQRNERGEPSRLILPVGPTKQYPILAAISNRERLSWKHVHVFLQRLQGWQRRRI